MSRFLISWLFAGGFLTSTLVHAMCLESPQAQNRSRESYLAALQQQEVENDAKHARQMSKILSDIGRGDETAVREDVRGGVSPDAIVNTEPHGISLLAAAVAMCREQIAEDLVALGASANGDRDELPGSALNEAATIGLADLAGFLIRHGADVNQPDAMGATPLANAVFQHHPAVVSVLLRHGAKPNYVSRKSGKTLLDLVESSKNPVDQTIANELTRFGARENLKEAR
jgi:ankyrin repeat protein